MEYSKQAAAYLDSAKEQLEEIAERWERQPNMDRPAQRQELNETADALSRSIPYSIEDEEREAIADEIHDHAGSLQAHAPGAAPEDIEGMHRRLATRERRKQKEAEQRRRDAAAAELIRSKYEKQ